MLAMLAFGRYNYGVMKKPINPIEELFPRYDLRSAFEAAIARAGRPDGDGQSGSGSGDGNSGGSGAGSASGSSGSGDTGSSGTSTDSGSAGEEEIKDPEKKRLHDEAAAWRVKHKDAETQLAELQKQLRSFEDKDKSELEKAQRDLADAQKELEKVRKTVKDQAIKLAFFESGASAQFKNPATALRLLDLGDVKIEDDGTVDKKTVKEKADALLKAEPYLSQSGDSGSGSATGDQASGRAANGKKTGNDLDMEALQKKFPALRR